MNIVSNLHNIIEFAEENKTNCARCLAIEEFFVISCLIHFKRVIINIMNINYFEII